MKSALLNINDLLTELFSKEELEILKIVLEKDNALEDKLSKLLGVKKDV